MMDMHTDELYCWTYGWTVMHSLMDWQSCHTDVQAVTDDLMDW